MENPPQKNLTKKIYRIANFPGLFHNCIFFQFISKKILLIAEYLLLLMSFEITLVREQLLVCLQLENISPFPKTNKQFHRCGFIPFFFDVFYLSRILLPG